MEFAVQTATIWQRNYCLPPQAGGGEREKTMSLEIVPISLKEANVFVEEHHRHHHKTVGHKFSIGCSDGYKIVGVAIVGRPVARHLDDGWTLEVNKLCTDGTYNGCSMLYAAAWRAARAMGYKRLVTYDNVYGRGILAYCHKIEEITK